MQSYDQKRLARLKNRPAYSYIVRRNSHTDAKNDVHVKTPEFVNIVITKSMEHVISASAIYGRPVP